MKHFKAMDWGTFILAVIVLLSVVIPLIFFPTVSEQIILTLNDMVTGQIGALYLGMGLAVLIFVLYISFGKYGHVTLGKASEEPEFSTLSWAAMLFCAGIGSSILYWGPIAWAIYVLPALPIAYSLYVKKVPIIKISHACRPILGKYSDNWIGKIIDVLFIFGLLGGAGTTLGLGTPMIAAGIGSIFNIDGNSLAIRIGVLVVATLIFAISSYSGLKYGIKILSDINIWLTFGLLIFVFIFGPTVFIMETSFSSLGLMFSDFFRMATWLEPFGGVGKDIPEESFPQSWTVFYWAWWLVYAPFVGLFIARISKGRNLKEVVLGTILYGTLGSVLFFGILGNYGLWLELSGTFSVTEVLQNEGGPVAIMSVLNQLPLSKLVTAIFVIVAILYLATTFDSGSYILAGATQTSVEDEPYRWNRLFWAFALSLLPFSLLLISGDDALNLLQTASIVAGVPLILIFIMLMISFMKTLSNDRIKLEERSRKYKEKERRTLSITYAKEKNKWWEK